MALYDLSTHQAPGVPLSVLRIKKVTSRTGLGRSSIYSKVNKGTFPKPIKLGERSVGWLESDINKWIASRAQPASIPESGDRDE